MSRVFHVRSEGTDFTIGTVGSPNIVISFSFYENAPGDIFFSIESHDRPEGVTGIFTAGNLVASYIVTNGSSYRVRSTGISTCTLDGIGYTAPPALSSLPAVLISESKDDDFVPLYIPWSVTFLGTSYPTGNVFLGSNTYLTFGSGSKDYSGLSASKPALPKIMIGCGDNSYQRVNATSGVIVPPSLGNFDMTRTFGDSAFTITQPSSNSSGAFTYSVIAGTSVISMSGTTITIASAGTATVQASQTSSGIYAEATKNATITINRATPTLVTSQSIFYQKFISGASISFNVISSNAGAVSRNHESNDTAVITIPALSTPSASIAGPGKTTIKVTQLQQANYEQVGNNNIITIVVVGQGKTYDNETMTSLDLVGTNLSGSTFNSCNLTDANLYNVIVNASTNFTTSTLTELKSGRITGVTSLLPAGFTMI